MKIFLEELLLLFFQTFSNYFELWGRKKLLPSKLHGPLLYVNHSRKEFFLFKSFFSGDVFMKTFSGEYE